MTEEIFTPTDCDDGYPGGSTIRVRSGRYVDLLDPDPATIDLGDIAHALASLCRFGGHTATFYSVAEHSLFVANAVRRQFGQCNAVGWALMHDATEAYLGDVVRPLKRTMPQYIAAEQRMARAIGIRFGFPAGWDENVHVHDADQFMLVAEMTTVRDAPWRTPTPPADVVAAFLACAAENGIS